jgi:hypothetical protein
MCDTSRDPDRSQAAVLAELLRARTHLKAPERS